MKQIQQHLLGSIWLGMALVLAAQTALADVKLPTLFSDHMVLQCDAPVQVWGWAAPGEKISVEIASQKVAALANTKGEWNVTLKPLKSGAHLLLTVQGSNKLAVHDVLVGEVWLGSGQSNMGLNVKEANHFGHEKTSANFR